MLKISFTFFTIQANLMRRPSVLSLPLSQYSLLKLYFVAAIQDNAKFLMPRHLVDLPFCQPLKRPYFPDVTVTREALLIRKARYG
jgi:hypothetical protein